MSEDRAIGDWSCVDVVVLESVGIFVLLMPLHPHILIRLKEYIPSVSVHKSKARQLAGFRLEMHSRE